MPARKLLAGVAGCLHLRALFLGLDLFLGLLQWVTIRGSFWSSSYLMDYRIEHKRGRMNGHVSHSPFTSQHQCYRPPFSYPAMASARQSNLDRRQKREECRQAFSEHISKLSPAYTKTNRLMLPRRVGAVGTAFRGPTQPSHHRSLYLEVHSRKRASSP